MKLYVASSWRNDLQPSIVADLRAQGHEVYDFRHPPGGDHLGFSWSDVDPGWTSWTPEEYVAALDHPVAVAGFESDFGAMQWADAGVLILKCGRSAHLEAGWFVGAGKPLWILLDPDEFGHDAGHHVTELMYRMASGIFTTIDELLLAMHPTTAPVRRAPVQAERGKPAGTIPWATHLLAWQGYATAGHGSQSAERIAERGGFGYAEVQCAMAGHYNLVANCRTMHPVPDGWEAR